MSTPSSPSSDVDSQNPPSGRQEAPGAVKSTTDLALDRTRFASYRTNVAKLRSHLANERTHLAYLRTTVSLIGFGITINRFSSFLIQRGQAPQERVLMKDSSNAGIGMVVLGLLLLVWSVYRYWRVSENIEKGEYVVRYRAILVVTIGLLLLGGMTALWLFIS